MQLSIHSANISPVHTKVLGPGDICPFKLSTVAALGGNQEAHIVRTFLNRDFAQRQKSAQVIVRTQEESDPERAPCVCFALGRLGNRKNATEH